MILHVTFSDGSNPWVSLPADRHTIAKQWRAWMTACPDTAKPQAICGNYQCTFHPFRPNFSVRQLSGFDGHCYAYLGHALAALERLGGETP